MGQKSQSGSLAERDTWEAIYEEAPSDQKVHDWYRTYENLEPHLRMAIDKRHPEGPETRILHLGAGMSELPEKMADRFKNQICVDFSEIARLKMAERHSEKGIGWVAESVDVRNMPQIEDESVDVAFDKGTLDAIVDDNVYPPPEVMNNIERYMKEVARVLKPGGTFIYVSNARPLYRYKQLQCLGSDWEVRARSIGEGGGVFAYFMYVCSKVWSDEDRAYFDLTAN
ncbi:S-adenosyl-L-methionine-dependent methyltransferase [Poronia punctata]|nr:S-adenosyl-L-methionine-dependent methyltransferase [Poronia punctata]